MSAACAPNKEGAGKGITWFETCRAGRRSSGRSGHPAYVPRRRFCSGLCHQDEDPSHFHPQIGSRADLDVQCWLGHHRPGCFDRTLTKRWGAMIWVYR